MFRKLFGRGDESPQDWDGTSRPAPSEPVEEAPPEPVMTSLPWSDSGFVLHDGGDEWMISCSSAAEARLAKKEIRARQKELRIQKRELNAEMTQIRAHYRQKNASRGPAMRGGGNLGKFVRGMDQVGRAADRRNRENSLAPYERAKLAIDNEINTLERLVIKLDLALESYKESD